MMACFNQQCGETLDLNNINWVPLLNAHKQRSSVVSISDDNCYLKKTKPKRKPKRCDGEFYNISVWNHLLDAYAKETPSSVYSPIPVMSKKKDIIMEYIPGVDLDRMLRTGSVAQEEMKTIFYKIGQLMKIKQNESLVHDDFDLRHILINSRLNLIDFEKSHVDTSYIEEEHLALLGYMQKWGFVDTDSLADGFESIPQKRLLQASLDHVVDVYGKGAEYHLKYRFIE
jgi:hypothetical protein